MNDATVMGLTAGAAGTLESTVTSAHDVEQLWVTISAQQWNVLALVPADPDADLKTLADGLRSVSSRCSSDKTPRVIDARRTGLDAVASSTKSLTELRQNGGRALVVVDDPLINPASRALVLQADAAILAVRLGSAQRTRVQQILEACESAAWLGCVTLHRGDGS